MKKIRTTILAGAALVLAVPAGAATTMYQNSGTFLAAAGSVTLEDFNSATLNMNVSSGSFGGVTVSSTNTTAYVMSGAASNNVNGTTYIEVNIANGSITAVFDAPIFAFGASFFSLNNTTERTHILIDGEDFNPLPLSPAFLGFVSDTGFTSVTFANPLTNGDNDRFGLDNLYISNAPAVPEPASWAMLIFGMGLAGAALRRRKTALSFA